MGKRVTAEQRAEIQRRRAAGERVTQIGRDLGIPRQTVSAHLDGHRDYSPTRLTREQIATARAMRTAGNSLGRIADALGVYKKLIGYHVHDIKVPYPPPFPRDPKPNPRHIVTPAMRARMCELRSNSRMSILKIAVEIELEFDIEISPPAVYYHVRHILRQPREPHPSRKVDREKAMRLAAQKVPKTVIAKRLGVSTTGLHMALRAHCVETGQPFPFSNKKIAA